jgi:hypothetical protein
MYQSTKTLFTAAALAALLCGSAFAETVWKPPAEIAPKTDAGAAPATNASAQPSAADKEKNCADQARAKGLKGKAKKQFKADCLKS